MTAKISATVRLTQELWAYARECGHGSVSFGIAAALAAHKKREGVKSPMCERCGIYQKLPRMSICGACKNYMEVEARRAATRPADPQAPAAPDPRRAIELWGRLIEPPHEIAASDREEADALGIPLEAPLGDAYEEFAKMVNRRISALREKM